MSSRPKHSLFVVGYGDAFYHRIVEVPNVVKETQHMYWIGADDPRWDTRQSKYRPGISKTFSRFEDAVEFAKEKARENIAALQRRLDELDKLTPNDLRGLSMYGETWRKNVHAGE